MIVINKYKLFYLSLTMCTFILAPSGLVSAKELPTVKVEKLLSTGSSWEGTAYKSYPDAAPEISMVKITIPPHTKLPWHTHPMINAGYILSGEITLEKKVTGETRHFTEGQAIAETVGQIHRGVTGDKPVTLIVFYAGAKGLPLSEPSADK